MAVKSKQEIRDDIINYIKDRGGVYNTWYVGIATDVKQRLFGDHNVSREHDFWIYRNALSESDAREIEKFIIDTYKTKGGTGGGDHPKWVYAYKITDSTRE